MTESSEPFLPENTYRIGNEFEKHTPIKEALYGGALIRLAHESGATEEIASDLILQTEQELSDLVQFSVKGVRSAFGAAQSIRTREHLVVTTTEYIEGEDLPDAMTRGLSATERSAVTRHVGSLTDYLDSRIGTEKPLLFDVFASRQFRMRDAEIVLLDTEPQICPADSGRRSNFEAVAVVCLQNTLVAAQVDEYDLLGFEPVRDGLLQQIEDSDALISPELTRRTINTLHRSLLDRRELPEPGDIVFEYLHIGDDEDEAQEILGL